MVRRAAGTTIAGRGEGYVQYVRGFRVVGERAHASIQARNVYLVEVEWTDGRLAGSCTCPHAASGEFCKHQAAVAYVAADRATPPEEERVHALDSLPPAAQRELLAELMAKDPAVERRVELAVAALAGDHEDVAHQLVDLVTETLRSRGFVDYRRSFDVARDAQDLLDQLEGHLSTTGADAVRPALLRATTRLQKITLRGDDSGGVIGDASQRALDLYARSCREGRPERVKLARWLAKFRDESPGWPQAELSEFVEAFDDKAMKAYRAAVNKLAERRAGEERWKRSEVDLMRLELADHDGDVDAAIAILSQDERPLYGAIVERLVEAGRDDDVMTWIDKAVAADGVSGHGGGNDHWLAPDMVAEWYLDAGREDDAVAVLRKEFRRQAGAATLRLLVDFASTIGRGDEERAWALDAARELAAARFGSGPALIEIALHEKDLDAAWAAAKEFGPGYNWQPLADMSAATRPREAADLYKPGLVEDLRYPDTKKYAGIASRLARMHELYDAAGDADEFAGLMSELRESYGRRPSLMAALDREDLP